jgi:SulP family sulfate permease
MATAHPLPAGKRKAAQATGPGRYLPFTSWLFRYNRADLPSDLVAGVVTAIMLIPQGMAYAQLAGLPPQVGLYASVVPLIIYALLGTSGQLSVGPVAITSLLVFSGVGALAEPGSQRFIQLALLLALMVGALKLLLGVLRLGVVLNFISHPVLAAFTTASALIIAAGQLKYILGYKVGGEHLSETLAHTVAGLGQSNVVTLAIGLLSVALLLFFRKGLRPLLVRAGLKPLTVTLVVSGAPLVTVILGTLLTWLLRLDQTAGVAVVGGIPAGLSPLSWPAPSLSDARVLLPAALTIVLVSVVESIAVARALASKRRQAIDPNQELVALGAANIAAGLFSGYPVTGGFARSVVNFQAGAITGLASLITAAAIALILLFFTPLFFFLPQAVLAATVIVAVFGLVDLKEPRQIWQANRGDAITWGLTFAAVLLLGIETGIFVGVGSSLALYLWRTSRPHIAVVGRLGESEVYRNVLRYEVTTWPVVAAVRVDESLYFANARYLEEALLRVAADRPELRHLVLIGSAINFIDSSALHTLESMARELGDAGVQLHLAEIKGPVMDGLKRAGFVERLGSERIHLSTHSAMQALGCVERPGRGAVQ